MVVVGWSSGQQERGVGKGIKSFVNFKMSIDVTVNRMSAGSPEGQFETPLHWFSEQTTRASTRGNTDCVRSGKK